LLALHVFVVKMVSSFSIENKETADRGAAMWKTMLEK
jgi:hypothetical protein